MYIINKQELEKISKISVKIISSLNDKSYQGSTIIDITKQTNISDIDMQNYFKNKKIQKKYISVYINI
ncbi:hypothetical protein [Spiroplasma endosymbiont of Lariophagus distinguendus]|uniref:hypothetical protein n=1 Tax=Spiroplasma endosymbiont of Lariophagus distinguendus TaxID=2935082 RepID=UPI00207A970C|nr:hypothetical protein [Spiroplasma endosymbiont of Lariophagus distinguendus]